MTPWRPNISFVIGCTTNDLFGPAFEAAFTNLASWVSNLANEGKTAEVLLVSGKAFSRDKTIAIQDWFLQNLPHTKLRFHVGKTLGATFVAHGLHYCEVPFGTLAAETFNFNAVEMESWKSIPDNLQNYADQEILGIANSLAIQRQALSELRIRGRIDRIKVAPKMLATFKLALARGQAANQAPISLVIPTRNRLVELCRTLNSVSAQTCLPSEVVLVNDGEAFDEWAMQRVRGSLHPKVNLVVVSGPQLGAAAARQVGLETAKFDVVAYSDDDNILMLDWIAGLSRAYRDKNVMAVCGPQLRPEFALGLLGGPFNLELLKTRNYIDTGSISHRRSIGRWDAAVKRLNDWDFNLNLALTHKVEFKYIQTLSSLYFMDAQDRISETNDNYLFWVAAVKAKYGI